MIPQAMRDEKRWVIWKSVPNAKTGRMDKIPLDPRTKRRFKRDAGWQTHPAMWVSYDEAVNTGEQLGFLLGDGWAGLDLDDVIVNGVPAPWAQNIIRQFDTYTEISPSGTGLKLFMHGSIDGDPIGKRAGIEMYDRQRFFTVTGRALSPVGISDCTEALRDLYNALKRGDVLDLCRLRGLLLTTGKPGFIDLHCPWADEHSGGGNHTSTSLHVTGTAPDYKADGFQCFHAHCAERSLADLRHWLGLPKWDAGKFIDLDKNGTPSDNSQANIRIALAELNVELSYDEFQRRPVIKWPDYRGYDGPFEDAIRNRLWLKIDEQFKFRPTPDFFDTVLRDLARQRSFHPVRDYLNSLTWDGVPRIDRWLSEYAGALDNLYTQAVGSLFLRAGVNRVFRPGCKFDEMLVLVSPHQGLNKSTAFATLIPNREWFTDSLPLGADAKETIERTGGVWIVEVSDLHGMSTKELNAIKAFMSRQADGPARLAYDRLPTVAHRSFILAGTTNAMTFLKDKTGNRRFWPVVVNRIDIDGLTRDRDQLWAEAVVRVDEPIRLDPALYGEAGKWQRAHSQDDPWLVQLQDRLGLEGPNARPMDRLRLTQPWDLLNIPLDRQNERDAARIEEIMVALGYEKKQARGILPNDFDNVKRWCHADPAIAARARNGAKPPPPPLF